MTPEEIKAVIDAAIGAKVVLTYPQLLLFVLLSGVAAFIGAYLKKKGENMATQEDIKILTEKVEDIKANYMRQLEDYKFDIKTREQASCIAEFYATRFDPKPDYRHINKLSAELGLWLPAPIYRDLAACVCKRPEAKDIKDILLAVRKYLLKDPGDLKAEEFVHFV